MPSKLTELATICDKLTNSKVLERKKAADRLKALLSTTEVLKELDKSSSRDGFGICWTSVFEAVGNALLQELKGQRSSSAGRKPDMYSVVKFVLQQASTSQSRDGKPALTPEIVFEHITIMVSEYPHVLASEYAFLITSYFLTPTLWRHWKTADLHTLGKLLVKYVKGLSRVQPGFNAGPVSLAIERITVYMLQRIDVRPMKYLTNFKDFFSGIKDCNPQTIQNMLSAVNHLCEKGAVNSRLQLSQFGADIAMKLLQLWRGTKDDYKMEAVRFFRLQLVIADQRVQNREDAWQDVLWKLYEVLCQEIGSVRTSHKLAGDKLPRLWKDEFFNLLAHVCVILLPDGQRLSEVSQSVAESQYSTGRPAKRRRILSGWESLKANIVDCKDYQSQIAWIKVITLVVGRSGSDGFNEEQMKDVLTVMLQLLSNIKRPAVLVELHKCFLALTHQKCLQEAECDGCWHRLTVLAISLVERSHADFYILLSRLLVIGKLEDKSQLIRLIKRSVASPVSSQGISWLSHYLNKHQLALCPLLSSSDMELMSLSGDVTSQQTTRQQLWQHVWLAQQLIRTVNHEEGMCSVIEASETVCAEYFGHILAALVCKEPLAPIEINIDATQTLADIVTAAYKSMEFMVQTPPSTASSTPQHTVLQGVFEDINSLLVEKVELSTRLLSGTDNMSEYLADSLWLMEMVTVYLKATGVDVNSQPISMVMKELWAELSSKLAERCRDSDPDTSYLKGLLAVMATQSALPMDKALASALVSLAVVVMDKQSPSQSSLSSLHSSSSSSDCAFAIPALPEISSSSSTSAADVGDESAFTMEEQQLLNILLTLVHGSVSSPAVCEDVVDLLSRLPYDQSAGHARVVIEVLTCAASHWQHVDHGTILSLLFHTRGLIENYHADPQVGVASLKVINNLIPLVSSAQKLTNEQKEDLGEKLILIVNGLVTQLFVRQDDPDGSYQLMPCFGIEYRLALVDTLQQLVKADRHSNWKRAASKRCALTLDVQSYLIKALLDRDYVVRKTAIDAIDVLFIAEAGGHDVFLASKEQDKLFDLIYAEIRSLLAVSDEMSELARGDEERTRTATLLSLFQKILLSSPACTKKSLCAIFVFLNEENKHITCEMIARVLESAVPLSPYSCVKDMCQYGLGYVAQQWVAMQYKLKSFPISLFGHKDLNTFYRKHLSTFAPLAFGICRVWTELVNITSLSPCDIVCSELPSLLINILPRIANKMSRSHDCKLLYDEMESLLISNNIQMHELLRDKLADLLFALYTSTWDFSAHYSSEPEPNPPHFTKVQIGVTKMHLLKLLRRGGVDGSSLLSVLAGKPVLVTSLHCKLTAHVSSIKHLYELRQRVSSYQHFISDLLEELSGHSLSACQQHLVESTVSAAINIISWLQTDLPVQRSRSSDTYTPSAIGHLIQCMSSVFTGLVNTPQVLSNVVPRMTYCLLELSSHSDVKVSSASTALLKLIWADNGRHFLSLADDMEPLPKMAGLGAPFGTSHHSLHQLVDIYCNSSDGNLHDRSYLLSLINESIDSAEVEVLKSLTAEDGSSTLSLLVDVLIQNMTNSCEKERVQVLDCLVRLGSSFVVGRCNRLPRRNADAGVNRKLCQLALEYGDESDKRDFVVISHILHYYLHNSPMVMGTCDSVLATIFGSKAGKAFVSSLSQMKEEATHLHQLIAPYCTHQSKVAPPLSIELCTSIEMWSSYTSSGYEQWLRELTSNLSTACVSSLLRTLTPLCSVKTEFCELVLPYLIHNILEKGDHSLRANLSTRISRVIAEVLSKQEGDGRELGQRVGNTLLNIMQYLRTQTNQLYTRSVHTHTAWHNNFWLDLDYLQLARLSVFVKNFSLAALFAEIRIYQSRQGSDKSLPPFNPQQLMLEIYSELDDKDTLCGWGVNKLTDYQSRLTHYKNEMNWTRALAVNDLKVTSSADHALMHSLNSLQSSGLTQILDTFLKSIGGDERAEERREMMYEQALANMKWDALPTSTRLSENLGFKECLFMSTKSLSMDSLFEAKSLLEYTETVCKGAIVETGPRARSCFIDSLAHIDLLQILKDVLSVRQNGSKEAADDIVTKWRQRFDRQHVLADSENESDFKHEEKKLLLCSLLGQSESCAALDEFLVESTVSLSTRARQAGLPTMSEKLLEKFKRLHSSLWCSDCDLELASTYWDFEESDRAMFVMKKGLMDLKGDTKQQATTRENAVRLHSLRSKALRTLGCWRGTTRLESCEAIIREYLLPAVDAAELSGSTQAMEDAYHTVADFADGEYERLKAYMESTEFKDKLKLHQIQLEQESGLENLPEKEKGSVMRYKRALVHNREVNDREINATKDSFVSNMLQALTSHINTLKHGSKHDLLSVFRLVAIWFENEDRQDVMHIIKEHVPDKIATVKFLPIMCQLTARLSTKSGDSQTSLTQLVLKAGKEHPHHVIPLLFALKSAATDLARGNPPEDTLSRAKAAKEVLKMVGVGNSQLVKDYHVLTSALIQLANTASAKNEWKLTPSAYPIATISSLTNAHVLTHHLQPRASCDYKDMPHVYKYSTECKSAGGINQPKIIYCIGSDGKRYKQLCKGKDDTRQDAVMQQVFSLVNELLRAERSTRSIRIRTYHVVPLSQRSGLLEWCEGTVPVGMWLGATSSSGAHKRYHPEHWSTHKCREEMKKFKRSWTDEQYINGYQEICRNFPPVLRHYFLETFTDADSWLQARFNYSRSLAATSIVGYILGIGDRHTNNMLLDNHTGELIHIDFGVAFDLGKTLPTPETIPFRLTRDIIDGLGPTGVDGTFRRCCEKTLKVLRGSDRVINTILQVLIDDPLLDWTLTAERLEQKQKKQAGRSADSSLSSATESLLSGVDNSVADSTTAGLTKQDANKHQQAANTLLRVKQKLQGYEQNSQLSVGGQVNYLIQQATDPRNLAKLFVGWQPFL